MSTTGCCFCFGSISSFLLELFLPSFPVEYCTPTNLGSSSFCLFILFMGFSRHEYRSGLPFPSPVDHILSELSTTTHPSWVALYGMAHSFIELDKAVIHGSVWLVFCDCTFHSVCPLMNKDKRLLQKKRGFWKLPDGKDWLWGNLGLALVGGAIFSKSLIQFSVDGWSCVPSLLFTWG